MTREISVNVVCRQHGKAVSHHDVDFEVKRFVKRHKNFRMMNGESGYCFFDNSRDLFVRPLKKATAKQVSNFMCRLQDYLKQRGFKKSTIRCDDLEG